MSTESADSGMTCAICGSRNLSVRTQVDEFEFGSGGNAATLKAEIEVYECRECAFTFSGPSAEVSRHKAVCRHLEIMPPDEVRAVRERYGMSRQEFSELTRLGEASIGRWEAGSHFQNRAYDSFLYLLCFEKNVDLLRNRKSGSVCEALATNDADEFKLKLVHKTPQLKKEAESFHLRPGLRVLEAA